MIVDLILGGLALIVVAAASCYIGWLSRGAYEKNEARDLGRLDSDHLRPAVCTRAAGHDGPCNGFPAPTCPAWQQIKLERAATPGPRETQNGALQTKAGQPVESPRYWDRNIDKITGGAKTSIPYDDLEGMFLDQFLLRYFYSLMPQELFYIHAEEEGLTLWQDFVRWHPWAKEMPLLFEQLSGYALNDIQLNNAIAEWERRVLENSAR